MRLMFFRKGLRQSIGLLIFNRRGWKKEIVVLQEKIGGPQERIHRAQENLRLPIFHDGTRMQGIRRMRLC